jgi:hypothetical protein
MSELNFLELYKFQFFNHEFRKPSSKNSGRLNSNQMAPNFHSQLTILGLEKKWVYKDLVKFRHFYWDQVSQIFNSVPMYISKSFKAE